MSSRERKSFVDALAKDEDDATTRAVFADWLDDHGEYDEAQRQRDWPKSKKWLLDFVRDINYHEEGDDTDIGDPHTYERVIEIGYDLISSYTAHFSTDDGADFFRSSRSNRVEFLKHWSIVTGVIVDCGDVADKIRVTCSC